jgi:hypothetical protein
VTSTGTTAIAENAAELLLYSHLTEATLVSLEYTGTATNGTDLFLSMTISIPAGDLTGTVTIDPTTHLRRKRNVIATIASVAVEMELLLELLILLQLP